MARHLSIAEERSLTALAIRRPVGVTMVVLSVFLFGWISFQNLPRNLMPDISYPSITVRTQYQGAAPLDVEMRVSRRLEEVLSQVRNLRRITSISRAEASDVILEFAWKTNMSLATTDVREKVAQAILPDEASKPAILRYDPTLDPILQLGLYRTATPEFEAHEEALIDLRLKGEDIIERGLEKLPGVAGVQVRGGLEREIRIEVDGKLLRAKNVSIALVNQRLREENLNQASGLLYEGEQSRVVRTVNEFADVEEIRDTILRREGTVPIRLRDVATVALAFKEPEVITRIDGNPCVKIDVYKEADANVVEVARRVRERLFGTESERRRLRQIEEAERRERERLLAGEPLEKKGRAERPRPPPQRRGPLSLPGPPREPGRPDFISASLPRGFEIAVMSDQSVFIQRSLEEVRAAAVGGGLLAIFVLYLFLRRAWFTLAVGLSIPISVVATFTVMHLLGVSLNMMSLGGLALGIGMLVDSSIVVLESIFRREEAGDSPLEAAARGTRQVSSAVTASTLTTVAVFFPIVFVEGVAGQMFRDQALAVVISLFASLATALYFIPTLVCRRFGAGAGAASSRRLAPAVRLLRLEARRLFGRRRGSEAAFPERKRPLALALVRLPFTVLHAAATLAGLLLLGLAAGAVGLGRSFWALLEPLRRRAAGGLLEFFDLLFRGLRRGYLRLLGRALDHRAVVLAAAAAAAAGSALLLGRLENELIPEVHQGEFTVEVRLPRATRIEQTDRVIRPYEARLLGPPRVPGVAALTTTIGVEKDDVRAGDEGEHTAKFLVRLEASSNPRAREEEVKARIRALLQDADFESIDFQNPVLFSFKAPIEVEVKGYNLERLRAIVEEIEVRMKRLAEIKDVKSNIGRGYPEVQVKLDREMLSRHGLTLGEVGEVIRRKVQGEVPTYYTLGDRRVPIRARLREEHRDSLEELKNLVINPGAPVELRLADVVELGHANVSRDQELAVGEGPAEIRRIGHQRAGVVMANLAGMSLGAATARVGEEVAAVQTPPEFTAGFGGQKEEMDLAADSLRRALLLAVFLVYVVMAIQFESLVQPLIIIAAMPLAMVGVVPVLFLAGISLSIVVFIGMIVLAGIVVNNAIVLVDVANRLQAEGLPLREALIAAGDLRLRPILMTTVTTVLGLLPLVGFSSGIEGLDRFLGGGEGAEIRAPLAVTVIAGLSASTLLTLVVVPVILSLVHSALGRLRRGR
jgi:HAE1 family hydrophobic/amphiphilic exporter-1